MDKAGRSQRQSNWRGLVFVLVAGLALVSPGVIGQGQAPAAPPQGVALPLDRARELALKITSPFTLAAVGDLFTQLPGIVQLQDPAVQGAFKILRDADLAFGNQETNIADLRHYEGQLGGYTGPKEVAAEVKEMGIDLVSRGNNVAMSNGAEGMFATNHWLDEAGVVHGGTGRDLDEARAVTYVQTTKGRVGMVSFLASESGGGAASTRFRGLGGAAGVNILRVTRANIVTPDQLEALRKVRNAVYENRKNVRVFAVPPLPANDPPDRVELFGETFKAGKTNGDYTYTMNPGDLQAILRSVRGGKENADFMIVAVHSLEPPSALYMQAISEYPADFLVELAHKAIDNGADAFLGHGVHVLRGVEVYKGKPIFYGLHALVFEHHQSLTGIERYGDENPFRTEMTEAELTWNYSASYARPRMSQDNLESMVTESKYDKGRLVEVRLHPLDMGLDAPISQKGIPRMATGKVARRILEKLQMLSKPFGTTITIEGDVGVIRVAAAPPSASR